MASAVLYFLVGLATCFVGTLPFGPINLTVVKTTVDHDRRRGTEVALAASLVEILEALVAIYFGLLIGSYLESNWLFSLIIALIFIGLAVFVVTRKSRPSLQDQGQEPQSFFRKGLLIAALNPQTLPFWIFALAAINQYFVFEYVGVYLLGFLLGVFVGKLSALYAFVVVSDYLKTHLQESSRLVNRLLAAVLLFIGISQGWNAISALMT
jgi:threonine/homoserine/homoserine lactone efflux protein